MMNDISLESIAEKIGIDLEASPQQHYLQITTTCKRCRSRTNQMFYMVRTFKALSSIPTDDKPKSYKEMHKEVFSCKQCKKVMLTWDKEELVDYIMKGS